VSKSKYRRQRRRRARREANAVTVDFETYGLGDFHIAMGTEVHRRLEMAIKRMGQPVEVIEVGDLIHGGTFNVEPEYAALEARVLMHAIEQARCAYIVDYKSNRDLPRDLANRQIELYRSAIKKDVS